MLGRIAELTEQGVPKKNHPPPPKRPLRKTVEASVPEPSVDGSVHNLTAQDESPAAMDVSNESGSEHHDPADFRADADITDDDADMLDL